MYYIQEKTNITKITMCLFYENALTNVQNDNH